MDPLHLQGATKGSSASPVSQQILHAPTAAEYVLSESGLASQAETAVHLGLGNCILMPQNVLYHPFHVRWVL